jgi:hypothetical protein
MLKTFWHLIATIAVLIVFRDQIVFSQKSHIHAPRGNLIIRNESKKQLVISEGQLQFIRPEDRNNSTWNIEPALNDQFVVRKRVAGDFVYLSVEPKEGGKLILVKKLDEATRWNVYAGGGMVLMLSIDGPQGELFVDDNSKVTPIPFVFEYEHDSV